MVTATLLVICLGNMTQIPDLLIQALTQGVGVAVEDGNQRQARRYQVQDINTQLDYQTQQADIQFQRDLQLATLDFGRQLQIQKQANEGLIGVEKVRAEIARRDFSTKAALDILSQMSTKYDQVGTASGVTAEEYNSVVEAINGVITAPDADTASAALGAALGTSGSVFRSLGVAASDILTKQAAADLDSTVQNTAKEAAITDQITEETNFISQRFNEDVRQYNTNLQETIAARQSSEAISNEQFYASLNSQNERFFADLQQQDDQFVLNLRQRQDEVAQSHAEEQARIDLQYAQIDSNDTNAQADRDHAIALNDSRLAAEYYSINTNAYLKNLELNQQNSQFTQSLAQDAERIQLARDEFLANTELRGQELQQELDMFNRQEERIVSIAERQAAIEEKSVDNSFKVNTQQLAQREVESLRNTETQMAELRSREDISEADRNAQMSRLQLQLNQDQLQFDKDWEIRNTLADLEERKVDINERGVDAEISQGLTKLEQESTRISQDYEINNQKLALEQQSINDRRTALEADDARGSRALDIEQEKLDQSKSEFEQAHAKDVRKLENDIAFQQQEIELRETDLGIKRDVADSNIAVNDASIESASYDDLERQARTEGIILENRDAARLGGRAAMDSYAARTGETFSQAEYNEADRRTRVGAAEDTFYETKLVTDTENYKRAATVDLATANSDLITSISSYGSDYLTGNLTPNQIAELGGQGNVDAAISLAKRREADSDYEDALGILTYIQNSDLSAMSQADYTLLVNDMTSQLKGLDPDSPIAQNLVGIMAAQRSSQITDAERARGANAQQEKQLALKTAQYEIELELAKNKNNPAPDQTLKDAADALQKQDNYIETTCYEASIGGSGKSFTPTDRCVRLRDEADAVSNRLAVYGVSANPQNDAGQSTTEAANNVTPQTIASDPQVAEQTVNNLGTRGAQIKSQALGGNGEVASTPQVNPDTLQQGETVPTQDVLPNISRRNPGFVELVSLYAGETGNLRIPQIFGREDGGQVDLFASQVGVGGRRVESLAGLIDSAASGKSDAFKNKVYAIATEYQSAGIELHATSGTLKRNAIDNIVNVLASEIRFYEENKSNVPVGGDSGN